MTAKLIAAAFVVVMSAAAALPAESVKSCSVCERVYTRREFDQLELERNDLVPDGITVDAGDIYVWRQCPCGNTLVSELP